MSLLPVIPSAEVDRAGRVLFLRASRDDAEAVFGVFGACLRFEAVGAHGGFDAGADGGFEEAEDASALFAVMV